MRTETVKVDRDIQAERRAEAASIRDRWTMSGTLVVNLVSSPGSGKTSLLEAMFRFWNDSWNVAVLVGDITTDRDAERLRPYAPTEQLTTGGACHLPLSLVKQGFDKLTTTDLDFLFVENIGNLVCPASHDLGEHLRVVLISTTEGDDKPGKYPKMFRTSDAMVVTKTDLLPYVPFDVQTVTEDAYQVRSDLDVFCVSAIHDEGISEWCKFLEARREQMIRESTP